MLRALFLASATTSTSFVVDAKPHIWVVVVDDVGFADTGIHTKSNIPMPAMNKMAKDGVVLDNYYTQTVCSPSRSALLTGQFPFRFGFQHPTTVLPGMAAGVPLDMPMLPAILKNFGYERHMIGKWHCGYATWAHTPMHRGFQSYTGYLQAQGDYYKHDVAIPGGDLIDGLDFWEGTRPMWDAVGNYSLDIYLRAQARLISGYMKRQDTAEKRAEHPLFVYLAHQTVHIPLEPRKDEVERCGHIDPKQGKRRDYCSMLVELDDALAELVGLLKTNDLYDNTLIILTTDNSGMTNWAPQANTNDPIFPASAGSNTPLRGGKTTMYEGGVRSLAFLSGGVVPQHVRGSRFDGLMHVVDLSAIALRAGGALPAMHEELGMDGLDMTDTIFQTPGAATVSRLDVPINILGGGKKYSAIRFGDWKVVIDTNTGNNNGWFDENGDMIEPPVAGENPIRLYNLKIDPTEHSDVAAQNPEVVKYGLDLIASYVNSGRYMEPQSIRQYPLRTLPNLPHNRGVWRPFMSTKEWEKDYWGPQKAKSQEMFGGGGRESETIVSLLPEDVVREVVFV